MGIVIGLVAGALTSAVLWRALRGTFAAPVFARRNYRGAEVPVGAGVVLVLTSALLSALAYGAAALGWDDGPALPNVVGWHSFAPGQRIGPLLGWWHDYSLVLVACVGFGLLGLFDDLGASGDDRGFRGHLRAMVHGRLTTGGVKLVFGGLLAVILAVAVDGRLPGRVAVDALLIALAANLGNLFDRAPGRTIKVALLAAVPVLVAAHGTGLAPVAVVVGAGAGLLIFDLREELMLGDAGANVLGATLGLGVAATSPFAARIVVMVVLGLLNLASEKVSFSKVIDGFAPLRALDRLGRRPLDDPPPGGDVA